MENVGIKMLDGFEKEAYIKALMIVANADSVFHEKEKQFIELQSELMGIAVPDLELSKITIDDLELINNCPKPTKMSIVLDCITLGYVDGFYDDREKETVCKVASKLNISKEEVASLESWHVEYQNLIQKCRELLGYFDQSNAIK